MDYVIAIVGPKEEMLGFKGLGLEIHDVQTQDQAEEALFELKKQTEPEETAKKYAVVYVLETFIQNMEKEKYTRLASGALPAVIPIPGHAGSSGFGETKIKRIVEQAIGSDIFA